MDVITVRNLHKRYRRKLHEPGFKRSFVNFFRPKYETIHAVYDVSFNVAEGRIIGFIGPNGAGKSTTIKMMTGILTPDSGEIEVAGFTPGKDHNCIRHYDLVHCENGHRREFLERHFFDTRNFRRMDDPRRHYGHRAE